MEPDIFSKEALIIAGVTGSGDETGKVWETFMKLNKVHPLENKVGETGYEMRMYQGEGPGEVHAGMQVDSTSVPPE